MAVWKSTSKKRKKPVTKAVLPMTPVNPIVGLDQRDLSIVEIEAQVAAEILGRQPGAKQVLEVAQNAMDFGEQFRLQVFQQQADKLACRKGCDWCCYLKVSATVPEVLAIAAYLRDCVTEEGVQLVREKVAELAQDPRIFSKDEKPQARIPCALLLQDGSCGVYEVRPLACRGWNSMDAESCKNGLDDPNVVGMTELSLVKQCSAIQLGLAKVLHERRLTPLTVELTAGFDVALNEPDVMERWLDGEAVFSRASADPT